MEFLSREFTTLISLFSGNWALLLGDILILCLAGLAGIYFIKFLKGLQIKRNIERIKQKFFLDSETREITAKRELKEFGYKEKHSILERLDSIFKQAGYLSYKNNETTETILIKVGIGTTIVTSVVGVFTHNVIAIAASIIVCIVAFWIATQVIADKNYVATQDEILRFINMADGYAAESDDIVYIIGKVYPNLKEPLYTYGKDFYYEAIHVGSEVAFQHFEERISHKKFREIIHNIYVCSKTSSNYKKIFAESRAIMRDYVDGKKERKNIKRDKIFDFCLILAIAAFSCFMADGISENFWQLLFGTLPGNILIILFLIVIAASGLLIFKVDKT